MNHSLWLVMVFVLLTGLCIYLVFFVYPAVLGPPPTLNQKYAKDFSSKQEPLTEVKATKDHELSPTEMKKRFFEEGVVGPFKLFNKSDLGAFLSHKVEVSTRVPYLHYPHIYMMATDPRILQKIKELLGEEVLLFGLKLLRRAENVSHRWHSDLKTMHCNTSATVWLGLTNIREATSLKVITHSHKQGTAPQDEVLLGNNKGIQRVSGSWFQETEEKAVNLIRQKYPQAKSRSFQMGDGDFIIFHGKAWHGSWNPTEMTRTAMMLQYVTPDCPTFANFDYSVPLTNELMPVVLVSGGKSHLEGHWHSHNLVTVELEHSGKQLVAKHRYRRILHEDVVKAHYTRPALANKAFVAHFHSAKREQRPYGQLLSIIDQATPIMAKLSVHYLQLLQYRSPHQPHIHLDEELIYILEGKARVTRLLDPKVQIFPDERIVSSGDIVYHPANCPHTITALGPPDGTTYLSVRFTSRSSFAKQTTATTPFLMNSTAATPTTTTTADTMQPRIVVRPDGPDTFLNGRTEHLGKLSGHVRVLAAGKQEKPSRAHDYDQLFVVEQGQLLLFPENSLLERGDLLFCPAHVSCGLKNAGVENSRYIAFEFSEKSPVLKKNKKT